MYNPGANIPYYISSVCISLLDQYADYHQNLSGQVEIITQASIYSDFQIIVIMLCTACKTY